MKRVLESESEKGGLTNASIIRINPGGGRIIMTTLNTLTKTFPKSMIARQFLYPEMIPRDEDGNYFIDTDPLLFSAIVNVLRTPDLLEIIPHGVNEEIWWRTLDYWGLKEYVRESDTACLVLKVNEEYALKVLLFEYRLAATIVNKHIGMDVGEQFINNCQEIEFGEMFTNRDMSGEIILNSQSSRVFDEEEYIDVAAYIQDNDERFVQYFERLLPIYKITITTAGNVLELTMTYIMTSKILEKVIGMEIDK